MKPFSIPRLIHELRRRRVFRGIVVNGATTLILLEAADIIFNILGYDAAPKWLLILLITGFLISLWFSWVYDLTPEGFKKTEAESVEAVPIPEKQVRIYKTTTFISILIIMALISYRMISASEAKKIAQIEKSIAVLPSMNKSQSEEIRERNLFIGHQITTCLLKVKDYRVVPWEDCRKYPRVEAASYMDMGRALSASILVDWRTHETEKSKHLSVDLVSAKDGSLLWSKNYPIKEEWSTEICHYSSKISKRIARKLRTFLNPSERSLIGEQPYSPSATMYASLGTALSRDAFEQELMRQNLDDSLLHPHLDTSSFDKAIAYLTLAIEEQPDFPLAYANRARVRLWGMRTGYYEKSDLPLCESDIVKATELDPKLPEAHIAMGFYYYYGMDELLLAHPEFARAVKLDPKNVEFLFYLSIIKRSIGLWDEVGILSDDVLAANPRNALFLTNLGISYTFLRQWDKALSCQDKAQKINPGWYAPYLNTLDTYLCQGQVRNARKALQEAIEKSGLEFYRTEALLDMYSGKLPEAVSNVERAGLKEYLTAGETEGHMHLLKGKIYRLAGDLDQSRQFYTDALAFFQQRIRFDPENLEAMANKALALAGLDRADEAGKQGYLCLELAQNLSDEYSLSKIRYALAQVFALTGDSASTRDVLHELSLMNSIYTSDFLSLDPYFNL